MKAASLIFSDEEKSNILQAIKDAEKLTSGEIRLYIESEVEGNVLDRAALIFEELKIHKTAHRNGVLFYLAVKSRKFAILGDLGINRKVGKDFWSEIKDQMKLQFQQSKFEKGLIEGIRQAGQALSKYYPHQEGDVNELADDIVFGN